MVVAAIVTTPLLGGCPSDRPTIGRGGAIQTWDFRCAEFALKATEGVKIAEERSSNDGAWTYFTIKFDTSELEGLQFFSKRKSGDGRIEVGQAFTKYSGDAMTSDEAATALQIMHRVERKIEATCQTSFKPKTQCSRMECPDDVVLHES
jgi:hypothetical protein